MNNISLRNITKEGALRQCTSCQMCAAVCHRNAISIEMNEDGFYVPVVNEYACISCGLCIKVCAKYESLLIIGEETDLNKTTLYASKTKDSDIVKSTTSGGIADCLARNLIEQGYKIIGVKYNPDTNRAEHCVANTLNDSSVFRGSKYIQSYSVDAFKHLASSLSDIKFAVFGLPCQIFAIRKFLQFCKREDKCLLIDLYCHGCPSMLVWEKVSRDLKVRLDTESFSSVNWRSKHRGWGRFLLEVQTKEGKVFRSRPNDNAFFDLFFSNQLLKPSCTDCKFRSTLKYTDIRLGDFWGPSYKSNYKGVSAVSVVSEKGKNAFDRIKKQLDLEEKKYENFLPYQSWGHTYQVDDVLRSRLLFLLKNSSVTLEDCLRPLYVRYGFKRKVKIFIKQLTSFLPVSVERLLLKGL